MNPLSDVFARTGAGCNQRLRLVRIQRDRLFAQHVLSGFQRAQRPVDMQFVGKRIVDRLDRGVRQQFIIGAIGPRDAKRGSGTSRLIDVARGDCVDARNSP